MRRQTLHGRNLSAYRDILTVHTDCPNSSSDVRSASTTGLKPRKQQRIAGVGSQRLQVMQYPAPGCHATGCDDHRRVAKLVKVF
ncbi:hypothetical protein D3C80_1511050 [compost metagenome]